jgi:hypothetical protein
MLGVARRRKFPRLFTHDLDCAPGWTREKLMRLGSELEKI